MAVKKESKKEIIRLMLQDVPTEEIAKRLNYSVGTVRKVFAYFSAEYGANTKTGLATAYLKEEILIIAAQIGGIIEMIDGGGQIATSGKCTPSMAKRQNKNKKRKK